MRLKPRLSAGNHLRPGALLIILCLLVSSCDKDEIISDYFSPVTEADLPKELSLGQSINILVKHTAYDGCGQFSRNETNIAGNEIELAFFAKGSSPNGICTDNLKTLETRYNFRPVKSGTYIFKFRQVNGFLTDTIVVQ